MRTGREFVLVQPVYRLKRAEKQSKLTGSYAALPRGYQASTAAAAIATGAATAIQVARRCPARAGRLCCLGGRRWRPGLISLGDLLQPGLPDSVGSLDQVG